MYWLVHSHSSAEMPYGVVSMLMRKQSRTVLALEVYSGLSPLGGLLATVRYGKEGSDCGVLYGLSSDERATWY